MGGLGTLLEIRRSDDKIRPRPRRFARFQQLRQTRTLDTENGGFIDLYARNVYTNSDAASKTNIQSLGNAMATLAQLRPVSFEWADKAHYFKTSRRSTGISNPKEMGFIAQEIEQVLPDIVAVDCEGHRVVNYSALIPLLTKSIQELNSQIETLKAEIEALKSGK